MLYVGIGLGIFYVVSLVIAFMAGYGVRDQKDTQTEEEQ